MEGGLDGYDIWPRPRLPGSGSTGRGWCGAPRAGHPTPSPARRLITDTDELGSLGPSSGVTARDLRPDHSRQSLPAGLTGGPERAPAAAGRLQPGIPKRWPGGCCTWTSTSSSWLPRSWATSGDNPLHRLGWLITAQGLGLRGTDDIPPAPKGPEGGLSLSNLTSNPPSCTDGSPATSLDGALAPTPGETNHGVNTS